MGRFQQLRAKALSLRGAVALGGALVMVASMTQVAGTLAAPDEVREAKAGIATQNYYPTPLPESISCVNDGVFLGNYAIISWSSAGAGMKYRVRIIRDNDDSNPNNVIDDFFTDATSYRFRTSATNRSDRVRIHTVNIESGETDSTRVVSSGYVSHTVHMPTVTYTNCSGNPRYDAPNQPWENQFDWDTGVIPFGAGPSPSIFGGQFDESASAERLGALPENDELASLDEATSEAAPTMSETAATSTSSKPISTTPSSSTTSESATTSAAGRTTASSTSVPTTTSSPSRTTSSAVTSPTTSASAPSSTSSAPPSMRARVGDDPIAVGASQARLEDVDGEMQLIVTRSGSEVCAAEVDGASRIESAGGALTVTISGRAMPVDLEACDLT